jgi:hypothetical protein
MLNTRIGENYNANDVINPNDLRKRILNVDSRFRSNASDPVGNFQYRLEHTYKNVIRLRVSSVEIPNTFYTFSLAHQNTTFSVSTLDIMGITRSLTVSIPEGNYSANELITVIQDQFDAGLRDTFGIFLEISLNVSTAKITITNTGLANYPPPSGAVPTANAEPTSFTFQVSPPSIYNNSQGLGYNLGFRVNTLNAILDTSGALNTYVAVATSVVNVIGDTYLLLGVNDLHTVEHKTKTNYLQTLAKIVVREDKNMVIYDDYGCCITNEIVFPQPQDLTVLQLTLRDPYGGYIDLNGLDYSITIEITEVLNTRLYDFYRNYIWLGSVPTVDINKTKGMGSALLDGRGPPF